MTHRKYERKMGLINRLRSTCTSARLHNFGTSTIQAGNFLIMCHEDNYITNYIFNPLPNACPVTAGKKAHYLRYDNKAIRLANRRSYEKTSEFKEKYRYRSGVEAAMSQCKAKTGLRRLRVRGLQAISFCVFLKAIGINILRATAFKKQDKKGNMPPESVQPGLISYIVGVKEQFELLQDTCRKFFCRICNFGQMTRENAR